MKYLILLGLLVLLGFWATTKFRERMPPDANGPYVPVSELPQSVRQSIDHALVQRKRLIAIKIYRDATRAPLGQAKQAIDQRQWHRDGSSEDDR